jgi:hypothetical protein
MLRLWGVKTPAYRLPVSDDHFFLDVPGGRFRAKPFQIIVKISISVFATWDPRSPIIPALIDTGNNHNFSIQESHLIRWAGLQRGFLSRGHAIREGPRNAILHHADIWIHRNQSGLRDLRSNEPIKLRVEEGIAVYPSDGSNYPRIPVLGLRAIIKNRLKLVIDGERKHVSLRSSFWRGR